MASAVLDVMSQHNVEADGDGYARVRARRRTSQLVSQVFGARTRRSKMRSDSAWLKTEPRRPTSRPLAAHDAVDVNGKAGPSLTLIAVEVRLTLGDNVLGVAVDNALERLIVGRTLGPKATLVGLGYGEHLDVVDAVAAAETCRGAGRQREVLVFGHIGAMLERSGTAKSLRFPRKRSLTTTMQGRLCLSISSRSPSTRLKKSREMDTIFTGCAPSYEAGPASLQALQAGDTLRLAAPRRPRRLNVHASRTLKAATSGK